MKISAVIPVYNSADIVGTTVDRVVAFFSEQGWEYEVILVNDGSKDDSWNVIQKKAAEHSHIVCINLLHNYGQHSAVLCGLQHARGDRVVTLDDDLQNPPEEIIHLVNKADEGHDLVFGRFHSKKHAAYRRAGSRMVSAINERVFGKPRDLTVSNFRLLDRTVVTRMCEYRTNYPYITGLALMFAGNPANADVEHHPRASGASNYTFPRIAQLMMRILFNYSSWPLRVVAFFGFAVSAVAFLLGAAYLIRALFIEPASVPGWTTLVVLLSFFNGVTLMILAMLGEYLTRLLNQTSQQLAYQVKAIVRSDA